jgi:hypothetical protein
MGAAIAACPCSFTAAAQKSSTCFAALSHNQ